MTSAFVIGGVSWNTMIYLDAFPQPIPQTLLSAGYHDTIGATGAGKALNLRQLGVDVTLHAMIGADEYGDRIRDAMTRARVSFLYDLDAAGTSRHVNLMSADGGRISIFLNAGTFTPIIDSERLHPIIQTSDYILLNIINYARSLIPAIQQYKKPIWCDLHDYDGVNPYHHDFVQAADYVFMSSDAMPDYRAFMQQLIAAGKQLVVCTHGRRGATALSQASGWLEVPAASGYAALDTNGAGDAFMAGYIYGHAQGWDVLRCLQTATIAAGLAVTSRELAAERLEPELVLQEHQRLYGPAE